MNKITDFPPLLRLIASLFSIFFLVSAPNLTAQDSTFATYRVLFRDKGPGEFAAGSDVYRKTEALHTARCINRRKKVMHAGKLFSLADAPVHQPYLDSVRANGAELLLALRWNNYAVIRCDSIESERIAALKFVENVRRTSSKMTRMDAPSAATPWIISAKKGGISPVIQQRDDCGAFRYGTSFNQAAMLGVPELHAMGITGDSALIGFLDSGFRWKINEATQNAQVLAEYDFIHGDSATSNELGDVPSQDDHGSIVFSTVCGLQQDSLIGIAPFASFMLAKTEDIPSETRIEEDNYAAAIEWLESQGADISTSSLGYSVFNPPDESYSYAELDGHTTIVADIINKAVARGMTALTAAGNEGPRSESIISPADADSVIAVAALMPDGNTPARFTSRGSRADGAIKPDIAALGVGVVGAVHYTNSGLRLGSGTSLATPLIAGCAGLIMSVFPEITPWQLRSSLYFTGSQHTAKDDTLGFGRANVPAAMMRLGTIVSRGYATYPVGDVQRFAFYIRTAYSVVQPRLIFYPAGSVIPQHYPLKTTDAPYQYIADIPQSAFPTGGKGTFYLEVTTSGDRRTMPYFEGTNERTIDVRYGEKRTSCGIDEKSLPASPSVLTGLDVMPSVADASREQVAVTVPLDTEIPFTVEAYNSAGQRVWSNYVPSPHSAVTTCLIPSSTLAVGLYFSHVSAGGKSMTGVLVRM